MANEITSGPGDGQGNYPLLLLFPIAAPKVWVDTVIQVVPTPSATLPDWAVALLTTEEKAALDSGDGMFRVVIIHAIAGLTNPQLATRAREIYTEQLTDALAWYANVYKYPGNRINTV